MNSATASYNPSHEGNNSTDPPKEVQGVPILTLNDGHTIPMVSFHFSSISFPPTSS
jgi:hypothetical protein